MPTEKRLIPTGATEELSLRVSVATLVRVVFQHPKDRSLTLALERRATLLEQNGKQQVLVKCQPFGGAVRLHDLLPLQRLIGDFHFDSERSRSEQDFRLFVRPADWEPIKQFCLRHLENEENDTLETGPGRELAEEFSEALGMALAPEQFHSRPLGTVIEDHPSPTENSYARGYRTVRVYRIFESRLLDATLCQKMAENSERIANEDLQKQVIESAHLGGSGWANAVLTLPLEQLMRFYLALSFVSREAPVWFRNHFLDESVCAILEGVSSPKYRHV